MSGTRVKEQIVVVMEKRNQYAFLRISQGENSGTPHNLHPLAEAIPEALGKYARAMLLHQKPQHKQNTVV